MSDTISVLELLENSIRNNESEKVQLFLINSLKATLSNKTSVPKSIAFSEKEPLDLDKPIPYFPVESNPIPYHPLRKRGISWMKSLLQRDVIVSIILFI